ncbi:MAG: hypothetical protein BWY30_00048 [Tenericutes bacterium ADurb.Bin239]|jgi:hypothetical protein|nr:MAG: hypothetical protein BWY30_00048 [Tenericutes bacterium ADurb.Bin239]
MANYELSQNTVASLLSDDIHISPNTKEKLNYFRTAIKNAYPEYRKTFGIRARSFEVFAEIIIKRHSRTIKNNSIEYQRTYFKNSQHIDKIIKDVIKAEEAKQNPNHTFTRDEYVDPIIFNFENLIDRRYQKFKGVDASKFKDPQKTLYNLTDRFFQELVSGIMLLEREFYNDSFIIWRSLLETTTTLLILYKNEHLVGKFSERRNLALMRVKVKDASRQVQKDKSKETRQHLGKRGVPDYIAERIGWAGELIKKDEDYTLKTLLELVNMGDLYPHYAFASLFVHEYLISPDDLKLEIDFEKYLLTLYFKLYEAVRVYISDLFTNDLADAKKLEQGVRTEVKNFNGRFIDFSAKIQTT